MVRGGAAGSMLYMLRLLCLATGAAGAAVFGGTLTKGAAAGWLKVWRAAYKTNDGSVPELKDSELPAARRLVDGRAAPPGFPIWGSIIDDMWVVEEDDPTDPGGGAPLGEGGAGTFGDGASRPT